MKENPGCRHPEQHHNHLCVLKTRLAKEVLTSLTSSPRYRCRNCGGRVREGRHLCEPERIRR